jgi:hypothetical protein
MRSASFLKVPMDERVRSAVADDPIAPRDPLSASVDLAGAARGPVNIIVFP